MSWNHALLFISWQNKILYLSKVKNSGSTNSRHICLRFNWLSFATICRSIIHNKCILIAINTILCVIGLKLSEIKTTFLQLTFNNDKSFIWIVLYIRLLFPCHKSLNMDIVFNLWVFRWLSLELFIMSTGRYKEDEGLEGNVRQHCHI